MNANAIVERTPTACAVIDEALLRFRGRSLVSGTEVVDFLLDLRGAVDIDTQLELLREPVPG